MRTLLPVNSCLRILIPAVICGTMMIRFDPVIAQQSTDVVVRASPKTTLPTELPVGVIGSFSPIHYGPCYLASRTPARLFMFPIVVGQQRSEIVSKTIETGGATSFKSIPITLLRRGFGLAPLKKDPANLERFGTSKIIEADASGLLWSALFDFQSAPMSYKVKLSTDEKGLPIQSDDWGAGSVKATWYPGFAEPNIEGIVIQIAITNNSPKIQRYFVDLLGGLETIHRGFVPTNPSFEIAGNKQSLTFNTNGVHEVFAIAASDSGAPTRAYEVTEAYLSSEGDQTTQDEEGNVLPRGVVPLTNPKPNVTLGLTRVSGINVDPGETRSYNLCIGIGVDSETASLSAKTLLRQSEKGVTESSRTGDLLDKALKAHNLAKPRTGDTGLDSLLVQSLVNAPFSDGRRVGVPNRQFDSLLPTGAYQSGKGGWLSLGWAGYRADWAESQLVQWFLSKETPPPVPPVDLFALWELYQRTHNRDMLDKFYPSAFRRYREFLAAGKRETDSWLLVWTDGQRGLPFANRVGQRYSADYSAYAIRSAKILHAAAQILLRPKEETLALEHDIAALSLSLQQNLWNSELASFASKSVRKEESKEAEESAMREGDSKDNLKNLLPLIAGSDSLTNEQNAALLKRILDPIFRSQGGLRSQAKDSPGYQQNSVLHGGIEFGTQWLFWKSLLDRGESAMAQSLALDILNAYKSALTKSGGFPEWLNGDNGDSCGRMDSSGDACALVSLYEAYHKKGTVTAGWDVCLLDANFDKDKGSLRISYRALDSKPAGVILCAMGKPGVIYAVNGGIKGTFTADANGVLTLPISDDATTQQVEIYPMANAR